MHLKTETFSTTASGTPLVYKVDISRGYWMRCDQPVKIVTVSMLDALEVDSSSPDDQISSYGTAWPADVPISGVTLQDPQERREAVWVQVPVGGTLTGFREY